MSSKRAKLTADKARERIVSLEESIVSREQKLDQLRARISRSSNPEPKLLAAQERLERRLELEREQIQKLRRLLSQRTGDSSQEGNEFHSEEIDDLHRSFEEVRQDLSSMKIRLESVDLPRDLPTRLNSFEERINRREEVASDLYSQILNLQNALDQERQTVRKLSRRIREQDQNLDALREAVEDSVVATVDLAERLEEMEENLSEVTPEFKSEEQDAGVEQSLQDLRLEKLQEDLAALQSKLEALSEHSSSSRSSDYDLAVERLQNLESKMESFENRLLAFMNESQDQTEAAPEALQQQSAAQDPAPESVSQSSALPLGLEEDLRSAWVPAKFTSGSSQAHMIARWKPAMFQSDSRKTATPR